MGDYEQMHLASEVQVHADRMATDILYSCLALLIVGVCFLFCCRRHKG